jgi:hypothetical protein
VDLRGDGSGGQRPLNGTQVAHEPATGVQYLELMPTQFQDLETTGDTDAARIHVSLARYRLQREGAHAKEKVRRGVTACRTTARPAAHSFHDLLSGK